MNVLSLFDGMSCGQQALERANITVDNYYASEIDKYAIQVTMHNYPNTKQLGSVTDLDGHSLPKIDLLMGGSPCQSFSFAGKRKGMATKCETEILTLEDYLKLKSDGYEFEGQSYLFWEYMRILKEVKPKYFLLENVMMGEKWELILSKAIGVNPVEINSALVSAQNRRRLYWTNIGLTPQGLFGDLLPTIKQPKDKGILLKDVLESEVAEKYFLSGKMISFFAKHNENNKLKGNGFNFKPKDTEKKSSCINARTYKMGADDNYIEIDKKGNIKNNQDKAGCFTAGGHSGGNHSDMDLIVHNMMPRSGDPTKGGTGHLTRNDGKTYCLDTGSTNAVEIVAMRGHEQSVLTPKRTEYGKKIRKDYEAGKIKTQRKNVQQLEPRNDGKTNCLTSVQKDNLVIQLNPSKESGGKQPYQQNRVYDIMGQMPAPSAELGGRNNIKANTSIRRLTPIECERLQTVKDNYTNVVSDSQRYKMLGNGWTIDVISHILNYIPKENFNQ